MNPILQFGTSRFLQAHVDLFVSEALDAGTALGPITVVQTTDSTQSARRIAAFNEPGGFPVRVRGLRDGLPVDEEIRVRSVTRALQANRDWREIVAAASDVKVIVSNTGDRGYELAEQDGPGLLVASVAPRSFPAKLLVLLHARFVNGGAPITIMPCELVVNNGSALRGHVLELARQCMLDPAFIAWLGSACVWVNSLVDRIVSEPIDPVGAVAEPYALWAIEKQPGMQLPCSHARIVVTQDLAQYERRKLFLLNLGHTFLAERWLREGRPADETVRAAMQDPRMRNDLEAVWEDEVLPIFRASGDADGSRAYLAEVRDRFCNPYLAHRIADIAQNHEEKKRRRLLPVVQKAQELGLMIAQPRLRQALNDAR